MEKILLDTEYLPKYELRLELWRIEDGHETEVWNAYNHEGDYIGDPGEAAYLTDERGIAPEAIPGKNVCSIGFCDHEEKWYGWSHRAMCGFGIGHRFFFDFQFEKPITGDSDIKVLKGDLIATIEEAKQSAINLAEAVS